MCENDEFVCRVLSRREVLSMIGATGGMLLVECSTGDDDPDPATATGIESGRVRLVDPEHDRERKSATAG